MFLIIQNSYKPTIGCFVKGLDKILFNMFDGCSQQIYSVSKGEVARSIFTIAIQSFGYFIFFMLSFPLYGLVSSV